MPHATGFTIVWQPYVTESPTKRSLPQPVSFPFLLDGDEYSALQSGRPTRLDDRALMLGILVAYNDPSPFTDTSSPTQLDEALADLVAVLRAPSLEVALLDASAHLRERHGLETARVALVTATKIVPASAMIRSDLIMNCWSLLGELSGADREAALQQIVEAYREADLSLIDTDAAEHVAFAQLVALCVLPGQQSAKETFIRSSAILRIRDAWYVPRVQYLLSEHSPQLDRIL